jgi:RNA polymerase sigma-70 factor (ECF subfamily)
VSENRERDRERDLDLARRCAAGEAGAWEQLVLECAPAALGAVRATLRSRGRDRDPALEEEIAHDALAALVEDDARLLKGFRGDAALTTFVAAIASRKTLRALRDRRRGAAAMERRAESLRREPPADADPADAIEVEELGHYFRDTLSELSPSDRLLLTLFYLDGRSYKEIAAATGLAATGIGTKISRARTRLAEIVRSKGLKLE